MKTRWIGVAIVAALAVGLIAYKHDRAHISPARKMQLPVAAQAAPAAGPKVILVADLSEANDPGDNCAEIISLVRNVQKRGVKVQILSAHSRSPIIKRYRVLTIPTVLVLDNGKIVSRYEGESGSTVHLIRERLASLRETRQ